jgi:hypothetical protein
VYLYRDACLVWDSAYYPDMDEPTPTTMALDDFTAFLDEHRRCDDLNAGVEELEFGHQRLWASCSCGASLSRNIRTDEKLVY